MKWNWVAITYRTNVKSWCDFHSLKSDVHRHFHLQSVLILLYIFIASRHMLCLTFFTTSKKVMYFCPVCLSVCLSIVTQKQWIICSAKSLDLYSKYTVLFYNRHCSDCVKYIAALIATLIIPTVILMISCR